MNASRFRAQFAMELRLTATNAESILLIAGIPILLLVFFGTIDVLPTDSVTESPIDFLVPGVLALAVMSTAFVNLAISTGFDRHYGILKRLGATPLTRLELLAAKTATLIAIETIQFVVIVLVGASLGWRGTGIDVAVSLLVVAAAALLATVAFAGLGFLLAGWFSGMVVLAAANATYIVLLLGSGMIFPLEEFSAPIRTIAKLLPSTALAEISHGALRPDASVPSQAWLVLALWAIVAPVVASRRFQWSPS